MNLTDEKLKRYICFCLEHKDEIMQIAEEFNPEDIKAGRLSITDKLFENFVKPRIMQIESISRHLSDFSLHSEDGFLLIDIRTNIKQLGDIALKYKIQISDFQISPFNRKLYGSFTEELIPLGGSLQMLALKAFLGKATAAQKASASVPFLFIDKNMIMVDFSQIDKLDPIAENINLTFIDCKNGHIDFKFNYTGGNTF